MALSNLIFGRLLHWISPGLRRRHLEYHLKVSFPLFNKRILSNLWYNDRFTSCILANCIWLQHQEQQQPNLKDNVNWTFREGYDWGTKRPRGPVTNILVWLKILANEKKSYFWSRKMASPPSSANEHRPSQFPRDHQQADSNIIFAFQAKGLFWSLSFSQV